MTGHKDGKILQTEFFDSEKSLFSRRPSELTERQ